ncbi:MAG: ATP-binding cassette domain-containing protein [Firmicutes bacterium]|nr:ATP-binding cassette domain-containing protein [Bacillota bacterium]
MVELKNISQTFDNGIERNVALKTTNLTIGDGEFVSIIGGNGAGKSTLMNIINGNLRPTTGSVVIDGVDITRRTRHQRANMIACVFQDPNTGVCPDLTVAENLAIAYNRGRRRGLKLALPKKNLDFFRERLAEYDLGLDTCLRRPAGLLSGGMRQVVTLLMATLQKPNLLLLDEHTSALDPKIAKQVMEITNRLVREMGITTIMISHNLTDAITYGDRMWMMQGGEVTMDVSGESKSSLTPAKLIARFEK